MTPTLLNKLLVRCVFGREAIFLCALSKKLHVSAKPPLRRFGLFCFSYPATLSQICPLANFAYTGCNSSWKFIEYVVFSFLGRFHSVARQGMLYKAVFLFSWKSAAENRYKIPETPNAWGTRPEPNCHAKRVHLARWNSITASHTNICSDLPAMVCRKYLDAYRS